MTVMIPRGGKNEDGVVSVVVDRSKHEIPRGVEVEWPMKPMTNAQKIRAMSDEELAKWIFGNLRWNCRFCSEDKRLVDNILSDELCDRKCAEHAVEWLRSPAEEVDDG